jgi:predicted RNA-binding protein with PUA-like domain
MTAWLFQGNPQHYTLNSYLRDQKQVTWHVKQSRFATEMQPGDQVFIWRSDGGTPGSGGVVAVGVLTSRAGEVKDDGLGTWFDMKPQPAVPSVGVLLDEVRLTESEGFLPKRLLRDDPVLRNLQVLRIPRPTNYRLSTEEAQALSELWCQRGVRPK